MYCSETISYVGTGPPSVAVLSGPTGYQRTYNPVFTFQASPGLVGTPLVSTQCLVVPVLGPAPAPQPG